MSLNYFTPQIQPDSKTRKLFFIFISSRVKTFKYFLLIFFADANTRVVNACCGKIAIPEYSNVYRIAVRGENFNSILIRSQSSTLSAYAHW